MSNEPIITEQVGDVIDVYLCPNKTPIAYSRKKKELMECCAMSEVEAEKHLLQPIPIELFYSIEQGLFGVESEALSCSQVHDPYTGKAIANENLPQ